jgi:CheY-like chemotaxis protein
LLVLKNSPVLLAEDDPNDALFLELAFQRAGVQKELVVVPDGQKAIDYLSGERERYPLPCLLVTDLRMPVLNGFDLLEWVQSQIQFKGLPAVVLSSSNDASDATHALQRGALGYFVKSPDRQKMADLVRNLQVFWTDPKTPAGSLERPLTR